MIEFDGSGKRLREIRESFKLTRRQFGDLCGLKDTRINYLEADKGKYREGELEAIKEAITALESKPPTGRRRGETGEERAARLQTRLAEKGKSLRQEGEAPRATDYAPVLTFPQVDDQNDSEESEEDSVLLTAAYEVSEPPVTVESVESNGHVDLDPATLEKLADEAERGYDVDKLKKMPQRTRTTQSNLTTSSLLISVPITEICPDCGDYYYSSKHVHRCVRTAPKTPAAEVEAKNVDVPFDQPQLPLNDETPEPLLTRIRPLTNSEAHDWNRCRRKWWLTWYRGLVRNYADLTDPRAVGTRLHRALAEWYVPDGSMPKDPRAAHAEIVAQDWDRIANQVDDHSSEESRDQVLAEISKNFNDAVQLERTIIEGYLEWLEETAMDSKIHVTDSEMVVSATIDGEVAGEYVKVEVIGRLDVRATRTSDNARLFIDHKSVSNFATPMKTLHMDPQMLHYMLLEAFSGTAPVDQPFALTALYNMLRKVGRSASAKPPFYDRVEIHHSPVEIESYRKRLLGIARDTASATADLDQGHDHLSIVYPTPTRDCSWDCDFFSICPMFDDGSRVEDAVAGLYHVEDPLSRYSDVRTES